MDKISDYIQERLDTLYEHLCESESLQVGYPCNKNFTYDHLAKFLKLSPNNVGDPFHDSNFRSNTHEIEREVVLEFARLMHLNREECWGYVTSGGTEGNMYGLYLAREMHPRGLVYFSEEAHYSVLKNMHVLNTRNIMIKSQNNGEIDYDDLRETVRINRDSPAIVLANIGTTMKGAVDDVVKIRGIFNELAVTNFYIHADAALHGMILPFVDNPPPYGFDVGYDSVSISGHKLIGTPFPCGVVLAKQSNVAHIARAIEYVGVLDTTLSGSRNAVAPLMLWSALQHYGTAGLKQLVRGMLENADYAIDRFKERDVTAWRNPNSPIVVFPKPIARVAHKWQIAVQKDIAHMITMPHVTRKTIDSVVGEYIAESEDAQ